MSGVPLRAWCAHHAHRLTGPAGPGAVAVGTASVSALATRPSGHGHSRSVATSLNVTTTGVSVRRWVACRSKTKGLVISSAGAYTRHGVCSAPLARELSRTGRCSGTGSQRPAPDVHPRTGRGCGCFDPIGDDPLNGQKPAACPHVIGSRGWHGSRAQRAARSHPVIISRPIRTLNPDHPTTGREPFRTREQSNVPRYRRAAPEQPRDFRQTLGSGYAARLSPATARTWRPPVGVAVRPPSPAANRGLHCAQSQEVARG